MSGEPGGKPEAAFVPLAGHKASYRIALVEAGAGALCVAILRDVQFQGGVCVQEEGGFEGEQ